jgi:hypothetical protein
MAYPGMVNWGLLMAWTGLIPSGLDVAHGHLISF